MREMKRPLLVLALALALCAGIAASASASTWTGRQLPGEISGGMLFAISCPTSELCVAVGGGNTVVSSTNPTGPASSWGVANVGIGGNGSPNQRQIKGVSCPTPQLCVAVNFEGLVYTSTNPAGGAAAWAATDLTPTGPSAHLYGVSCPSPTFCAASAGEGRIYTTTNPTGGAAAWTLTEIPGPLELRGVSCVSASFCVVVGDNGDNIRPEPTDDPQVLSSTNPLGGAWQRVELGAGQGSLFGVGCSAPALCVTGNLLGDLLVSGNSTGPASAWSRIDSGATIQITDADCPAPSRCVAIDNNADVLTSTDPTGGAAAWTFTNILPYPGVDETIANAMWGVSCPTVSFCAISAAAGQVFTSTDPFVVADPSQGKKKRRKRSPKRPRTTIAKGPAPEIAHAGSRLPVRYLFFARRHVKVRGFTCKLDRRPAKRCLSPKRYRVGQGKHVFRVRAIGRTGLRAPRRSTAFASAAPRRCPRA